MSALQQMHNSKKEWAASSYFHAICWTIRADKAFYELGFKETEGKLEHFRPEVTRGAGAMCSMGENYVYS